MILKPGECYLIRSDEDVDLTRYPDGGGPDSKLIIEIALKNKSIYYLEGFGWDISGKDDWPQNPDLGSRFVELSKLENIDTSDTTINRFIKSALKELFKYDYVKALSKGFSF